MSQCELVTWRNSTQGSPDMSSFNLKQDEIAVGSIF